MMIIEALWTPLSLSHERQGTRLSARPRATVRSEKRDVRSGDQERGDGAGTQPGSGAALERDGLVVDIDERHSRGEEGGQRARVKHGGAVAQIACALKALSTFKVFCRVGAGPIIQRLGEYNKGLVGFAKVCR